nr:U5 small nuclear ribonucleoprotein helicase [Tanacetum cinerariifolium]
MPRQPTRGAPVGLKPKSTFMLLCPPNFYQKAAKANGNLKVRTANKATTLILNSFYALSTLVDKEERGGNQTSSTNATPVVTNEASTSNPNTSTGGQLVESNEDEVEFSEDETPKYMFSTGGGGFCEDDLHFYDGYEAQVYDLP